MKYYLIKAPISLIGIEEINCVELPEKLGEELFDDFKKREVLDNGN